MHVEQKRVQPVDHRAFKSTRDVSQQLLFPRSISLQRNSEEIAQDFAFQHSLFNLKPHVELRPLMTNGVLFRESITVTS